MKKIFKMKTCLLLLFLVLASAQIILGADTMTYTLPKLPYAYDALEPHIDAQTLEIHHTKHHQSYVDGLNKTEEALAKARANDDYALIKHYERELAFHGSGHILHTLYWENLAPAPSAKPEGALADRIDKDFGSYDAFKSQFTEAAAAVEGSGWAILTWNPTLDKLVILQCEKHQNLTQWDADPLLIVDVWEHAYYLKYQNKRPEYLENIWNIINWNAVSKRYDEAVK